MIDLMIKKTLLDEANGDYSWKRSRELAAKHGLKENTVYSLLIRNFKNGPTKERPSIHSHTLPAYLQVNDTVKVVDGVQEKDNNKIIRVTKVGNIFVEGIDDKNNHVAAYKVQKVTMPIQPIEPEQPIAQSSVDVAETPPTVAMPSDDDIVWEKKMVYDVQTANHFYRVKVDKGCIEIIDSEDSSIVFKKERLADMQLILKKLPELLEG